MSTLSDVLAEHSVLSGSAVAHLQAVVSEWQLLADLSFSDLLLWVPTDGRAADLRRPGQADHRCHRVRRRPGLGRSSLRRLPAAAARLGGGAGDVARTRRSTHRGSWIRRQVIPVRYLDEVVARHRTGHQQHGRPGGQPAGDRVRRRRRRPVPDGLPTARSRRTSTRGEMHTGPRAGDGLLRLDADGDGRLRQPERAVGLPPARLQRRGHRPAARGADPAADRRPVRRRRTRRPDRRRRAGQAEPADGGRGARPRRCCSGRCRCARTAGRPARWCWSAT